MQFPITSAYGNLAVGAIAGTTAAILMDVADDHGVSTLGQVGIGHIAARQELREMISGFALPESGADTSPRQAVAG